MHVVEVDDVGAQAREALVDALPHVGGVAPRPHLTAGSVGGIAVDAELGRERHLVATVGEDIGDQPLVVAAAVHVRGVDEGHADVDGVVQGRDRLGVVDLAAVDRGQRHAAESHCADCQSVAECDGVGHG